MYSQCVDFIWTWAIILRFYVDVFICGICRSFYFIIAKDNGWYSPFFFFSYLQEWVQKIMHTNRQTKQTERHRHKRKGPKCATNTHHAKNEMANLTELGAKRFNGCVKQPCSMAVNDIRNEKEQQRKRVSANQIPFLFLLSYLCAWCFITLSNWNKRLWSTLPFDNCWCLAFARSTCWILWRVWRIFVNESDYYKNSLAIGQMKHIIQTDVDVN